MNAAEKHITNRQIQLVKTVTRQHMSDDEYYEMLTTRFGVSSCTQLTADQTHRLINLFKKWGWKTSSSKKQPQASSKNRKSKASTPRQSGNMTRMVSPGQKKKIGALARLVEWRVKDGLTKWVAKRFGIDRILTAQQAWQVIEGLKKMFEREMVKGYGPDWKRLDYVDDSVMRYIYEYKKEAEK